MHIKEPNISSNESDVVKPETTRLSDHASSNGSQPTFSEIELTRPAKPPKNSRLRLNKLFRLVLPLIVLITAIAIGYSWLGHNLKLVNFSGINFNLLVPKDYAQTSTNNNLIFEKQDGKGNKSFVGIILPSSEIYGNPDQLSDEQNQKFMTLIRDSLPQVVLSLVGQDKKLVDEKSAKSTKDNRQTIIYESQVLNNGVSDGSVKVLVMFGKTDVYTVIVRSSKADPKLADKADEIINSFKPEE